ncbi:cytochrome P450 [Colletotrichum scovillei]|uniref:Cytochrome P450 n=1 Tax=Colletotrichum scovillei TaxID=1209932 RepID=A0A9P7U7W2_9PEZI|nr:cytochrome P450 [Colletotrichum scovillei]KAF4781047.1 cytochrome P450 [Colletotrichum scovillei]KAG7045401.1 cytochrome P450 [Colletotrichum scovillei]KAG7052564.1 cytochrome P450 [Colletotrichum scovillei]KAG7064854.1 cytochrome P450 [Colletotrichum scovillei]
MGFNLVSVAIASAAAWLLYTLILQPLFLSPLSKIPAPHWSCHISPLWILYTRKSNRQNRTLHKAHLKLGPVVRIGPNELSVDGYDALKTVYQGGFEKDQWYSIFNNYGVPNMFSTLASKPHSLRKRMVSNAYAKSFIHASEPAKAQARAILFGRLLPLLSASSPRHTKSTSTNIDIGSSGTSNPGPSPGAGIDVFSTFLASTMDFITAYTFGLRNSTDFLRQKAYRDHWLQLYLARASHGFWPQETPRLNALVTRLGMGLWKLYPSWVDDANAEIWAWNWRLCEGAREYVLGNQKEGGTATAEKEKGQEDKRDVADEPVVLCAMEAGIEKERRVNGQDSILYPTTILQKNESVASEILDQVLAGQETAGIALTYLAWHLSRSPDLQTSLRQELLTLSPDLKMQTNATETNAASLPASLPDPKHVDALPILHAVIMETLRLHAPIPGPEPRQTPHSHPPCRLGDFEVPGGVRVAALGYTLHRNADVFPDPEVWDHTRWLASNTSEAQRREMLRYFWAFGSGGRMCVGSNFAMNEMKLIAAAIWTNFTTHVVDDTGIEQDDTYTARPVGERLILRFEHVE